MANNSQRIATAAQVKAIMNKRVSITNSMIGKRVRVMVQGNGNIIDVKNGKGELVESVREPGTVLQKKIFNARANTQLAFGNERNMQFFKDGKAFEKAGETDKAAESYNAFLNAVQLSFNILLPNAVADKITANCEVAGTVQRIDTENGSLLTLEPSTISVLEPESLAVADFDADTYGEEPVSDDVTADSDAATIEA